MGIDPQSDPLTSSLLDKVGSWSKVESLVELIVEEELDELKRRFNEAKAKITGDSSVGG
jgi:hypothetical protein